jgi:6-phosphogluconolactonase
METMIDRDKGTVRVHDDVAALYEAAARRWVDLAERAVAAHGDFHVALSGGTTPRGLYERLAAPACRERVDWSRVHIYFGDERPVPPDHADSNYRMAKEALLQHVAIPATQIHRLMGESDDLEATAAGYAQLLSGQLPADPDGTQRFDLVMLGMGPDGHVASLFPNTPVLGERDRLVAAVHVPQLNTWRLTVTLPVINAARHVMVLVAGMNKAPIMSEIMSDYQGHPRYPVEMIDPRGQMEWYIDRDAAPFL